MKEKISVFIITMLLCFSTLLVVNEVFEVEASEGGDGKDKGIGLHYDFMWYNITENLSDVVHKENVYPSGTIPKGRAWGTKGDNYTAHYILKPYMEEECSLNDVDLLQIGYLSDYPERKYSNKIEVKNYCVNLSHPTEEYPWETPISINEIFPFPSGYPYDPEGDEITHNYIFDNVRIWKFPGENWPWGGSYNNYSLNVTCESLNSYGGLIVGNLSYLETNDSVPSFQDGMVFIVDDTNESQEKIENMTSATGCIIIDDNAIGPDYTNTSNCYFSSVKVLNNSDNQENITEIKNMLKNGEFMFVDNILENETLTFTYNLDDQNCLPTYDYMWILDIKAPSKIESYYDDLALAKAVATVAYHRNYCPLNFSKCHGIILYDPFDTHFMSYAMRDWEWFGEESGWLYNSWKNGPALPFFTVNKSVGDWIIDSIGFQGHPRFTGYLNQEYKEQTEDTPGILSYNVVGYRNITNSPNDKVGVISNRYDGWWCEGPGDCGLGAGVVLAVAKYFNDYNIKPKYNLTFLMTTGEEYGMRGAQHFVDSHPNENFTLWIGADQLGFNQLNTNLTLLHTNEMMEDIIYAIINETDYESKVNNRYGVFPEYVKEGGAGTETKVWRNICDCICFAKDNKQIWDMYQRAGQKYTKGDVLENIDRNDSNATLSLFWNITKYFMVNPDCWIENHNFYTIDSDDADNLKDTVTVDFDVKSILPDDLAMVKFTLKRMYPFSLSIFKYINFSVNRSTTSKSINITLPENEPAGFYRCRIYLYNSTGRINKIVGLSGYHFNQTEFDFFLYLHPYNYSKTPPEIANVTDSPDPVGYGFNVTISADVASNVTSIDMVTVNISYPDDTLYSFNMSNTVGDTYEYIFNDTWQHGQYDFVIWANDSYGVENGSSQHSFNVTVNAMISVCTVKDSYGGGEIVNLTDPPGDVGVLQEVGYELLDNNEVLHVWNRFDSYYFNTSNGIQLTNHYDEYWSHNVLMLGYYDNDEWNLIYRTDELCGFNKVIDSDNESYVNVTLWKNLNYAGYDFRLAIRYHLGINDNELAVMPYIKNIGNEDIPYVLGFAWEIKDIKVDMTEENDYIEFDGTTYYLNSTDLDETYKNMDSPCFYIREDICDVESESLYLGWDENLDYVVHVKSQSGQYNAPVTLGIKIGTLSVGQEKYTSLFWHDAFEKVYYFDFYMVGGEEWTTNPSFMVDGNVSSYALTSVDGDVELCLSNTCNGTYYGTISKVEIRCYGYHSGSLSDIILRPVFYGKDGDNHNFATPLYTGDWSQWFDITSDTNAPLSWDWNNIKDMDCDVEAKKTPGGPPSFTLFCSKIEIRVTYNVGPVISDPFPANGSTGISIMPMLNITVYDVDNDLMNITWLSNSSGSWQVFGTNNSVQYGTYYQTFSNATENGKWWYWKVNVSDGTNYTESDVFSFYTGTESRIENTGSTSFSGYLLMRIDFYNASLEEWVVDQVVIDETTPRVINVGSVLGLDTIFNAQSVNTSSFQNGNGKYHVYACLRDPDGNLLYGNDAGGGSSATGSGNILALYEFTVTFD